VNTAGKTIDLVAGRDITMDNGTSTTSANGTILLYAGTGNISIETITAGTGSVSVTAAAGSIADQDDAGDDGTAPDITANGLILKAGNAIGLGTNHIEATVTKLTANAGNGGLFVTAKERVTSGTVDRGVTVESVTVSVNRVDSEANVPTTAIGTATVTQEDLSVTVGGHLVLDVTSGALVLNAGSDATYAVQAVSGNTRLSTQSGALTLNAKLDGGSGNVSVVSSGTFTQTETTGDIVTTGGTIDVSANAIDMKAGADTSASGNIRYASSSTITVGTITSTGANVSLVAAGNITDSSADDNVALPSVPDIDISATNLRVEISGGTGGFGSGSNHLETTVTRLSGSVGSNGFFMTESNDIELDSVAQISVNRVASTGVAGDGDVFDPAKSDLASGGALVLQTVNGSITTAVTNGDIQAAGHILLNASETAVGTEAAITLGGTVTTTSASNGSISLTAKDFVRQLSTGDITAGGAGTIDVEVSTGTSSGAITMEDGAATASTSGNIRYVATTTLSLGTLATSGNVSLQATSITDSRDDDSENVTDDVDVTASSLRVQTSDAGFGEARKQPLCYGNE
jgi:hypothetical protein